MVSLVHGYSEIVHSNLDLFLWLLEVNNTVFFTFPIVSFLFMLI